MIHDIHTHTNTSVHIYVHAFLPTYVPACLPTHPPTTHLHIHKDDVLRAMASFRNIGYSHLFSSKRSVQLPTPTSSGFRAMPAVPFQEACVDVACQLASCAYLWWALRLAGVWQGMRDDEGIEDEKLAYI